ncbi:MAG: single-stranded DNA-binding protein [Magnetococcales bacterium]|nr:single-stranded DNA-binding protein [Magnetococcales bacterium]
MDDDRCATEIPSSDGLASHPLSPAANQVLLEGQLLASVDYRVTPTGRPVLFLEIEHDSRHEQPDSSLSFQARMPVMALGELAARCRSLTPGCTLRVSGRLNQKRWVKDGKVRWGRLELVAMEIRMLAAADPS